VSLLLGSADWEVATQERQARLVPCVRLRDGVDLADEEAAPLDRGPGEYNTLKQHGQLDKEGAALCTCDKKKCKVALCSPCLMRLFGAEAMLEAST
jgi:hypothetical protein